MRLVNLSAGVLFAFLLSLASLHSEDIENDPIQNPLSLISNCLSEKSTPIECLGTIAFLCDEENITDVVTPAKCWARENVVWDHLLNATYSKILSEQQEESFTQPLRLAQRHWVKQVKLDCNLILLSNPLKYQDTIREACIVREKMKRYLFLQEMIGASWQLPNE